MEKKALVDQRGVESEYGIAYDTQEKLRRAGTFAPWLKVGRKIYYRREELERWLDAQQAKASRGTDDS